MLVNSFVVKSYEAFLDEVNFSDLFTLLDHQVVSWNDSAVHTDYKQVFETLLTWVEEVSEFPLEGTPQVVYNFGLHLTGQLIEEGELFYYQVEVITEGILYILADIHVKLARELFSFVCALNLADPQVALKHL